MQMNHMSFRKFLEASGILSAIILLIFLGLSLIPITHRIDRTVNGIKWEFDNPAMSREVSVTIDGTYKDYILHVIRKNDIFEGKFIVSGYDFTEKSDSFLFPVSFAHNMGSLHYGDTQNGSDILGNIYTRAQLGQGVILLNSSYCDSEHQQAISFPCSDRTQAADLGKVLLPEGFEYE